MRRRADGRRGRAGPGQRSRSQTRRPTMRWANASALGADSVSRWCRASSTRSRRIAGIAAQGLDEADRQARGIVGAAARRTLVVGQRLDRSLDLEFGDLHQWRAPFSGLRLCSLSASQRRTLSGVAAAVTPITRLAPADRSAAARGREGGSGGDDIVDQQHFAGDRADRPEGGAGAPVAGVEPGLRADRGAPQGGDQRAAEPPGHGPGQQVGLVEPTITPAIGRGRRPRDELGVLGPEGDHHGRRQQVDRGAPVAVLEGEQQVATGPVESQHRAHHVDPRHGQRLGRLEPLSAGRADRARGGRPVAQITHVVRSSTRSTLPTGCDTRSGHEVRARGQTGGRARIARRSR